MRPEYLRLGKGVRGEYYKAYTKETKAELPKRPRETQLGATTLVTI